jgi:capsule polysaccharide export protein KpsE/RkpR
VQQDLEAAEKEFGDFSSKNATVNIQEQAKAMVGAAASLQGEIIATQAQLEGLKQIYSENNVRVRSLRARLTELQAQLNKVGGKDYVPGSPDKDDSLYPSIRKLPVLGETYADLYRRTKVQETVFEVLTQQYELAKVSEAKEIPSVKVLDAPDVPEAKAFPPRFVIMNLGVILGLALGIVWVIGRYRWEAVDPEAPHKVLAYEVFGSLQAKMPWAAPNGSRIHSATHKLWLRLVPRNGANHDNGAAISGQPPDGDAESKGEDPR